MMQALTFAAPTNAAYRAAFLFFKPDIEDL
jgi:hypothetical protein